MCEGGRIPTLVEFLLLGVENFEALCTGAAWCPDHSQNFIDRSQDTMTSLSHAALTSKRTLRKLRSHSGKNT